MTVVLIATGGTIACTKVHTATGTALIPTQKAADLAPFLECDEVKAIDFRQLDSSAITLADVAELITLVSQVASSSAVERIIITHGTDSMEETALALQLFKDTAVPVILSGAQRAFDHPQADGPANLRGAAHVDFTAHSDFSGVGIYFGGRLVPAWGARKVHTSSLDAFAAPSGLIPAPTLQKSPQKQAKELLEFGQSRIAICTAFPGAPRDSVDAAVEAGCSGIVIEGMGSGNVGPQMGTAIVDALERGIKVVMATRVPEGEVTLVYGGQGGGATLADAGMQGAGQLSAGQARIALAWSIATGNNFGSLFPAAARG